MMYRTNLFNGTDEFLKIMDLAFDKRSLKSNNVRIEKDGKNYTIYVPAMGFKKEDIEVKFEDDILTIKGTINNEVPEFLKDKEIDLQYEVKNFLVEDVIAKLENGLLKVDVIAKKSTDALNKVVEIQ